MMNISTEAINSILAANADANPELLELVSSLSAELAEYKKAVDPYAHLLDLAFECKSMKEYFTCAAITAENKNTPKARVQFVNMVSNELTFARTVYDEMFDHKLNTQETITAEEVALVEALNEFYRNEYGLNFDVLDLCSYDRVENGERVEFNPTTMVVCGRTGSLIADISGVCVPILRDADGDLQEKAVVVGK